MTVIATADANLDDAKTADTMNGLAKSASGKLIALTPPGKIPGFGEVADAALGEVFSTDAVENALKEQTTAQMDAFGPLKRLSVAAQVNAGQLPVAALDTIDANGGLNVNFVDGPHGDNDVVMVDGKRREWDLDHDGTPETNITERQLYDATLGPAEGANDGMRELYNKVYDGRNPPDIDDLDLPDGLDNDNASTFEKVWDWPFDAPGEGTISNGDHVGDLPPVARYVLHPNGGLNVNFIDGPNGDNDVVRTGSAGTTGKKLVFDLNRNGKIDPGERTITERELYDATLGPE
jgi:hypothetical protein